MKHFNRERLVCAAIAASMLTACASGVKRADYPANAVPSDEIARLDAEINTGYEAQYDILADREFAKARSWVKEAKDDLRDDQKQSEILYDLGYARAYLDKAEALAADRQVKIRGILDARKAAVEAGAREFPQHRERIAKLDDRARKLSTSKLSNEKFDRMQTDYFDLELAAIQSSNLDKAMGNISAAKKNRAEAYAPKYLKAAEIDLTDAKNKIAVGRHNADEYRDAVAKANDSAQFLFDVTSLTRTKDQPSEDVAAEMVRQKHQIASLRGELGQAASEQAQLSQTLTEQEKQLSEAASAQSLDLALESARKEFNQKEAEVYRQGDKLLIRLKAMNFPTGKADLPARSLNLLAKVKGIAQDLNPEQVVVEGHTDSTGTNAINIELSQERAQAVAGYFEQNGLDAERIQAVGQGYRAPIANNKTKTGRAKNRRVDVIITPKISRQ